MALNMQYTVKKKLTEENLLHITKIQIKENSVFQSNIY